MLHLSNLTHIIIMVLNKLHLFNILLLVRDLSQEPLLHHTFNILFSLRFGHLHLVYMKNGTELQCKGSAFFTPSLPPPLAPGPSFYFFPVCLSLSFCLRSNNSLPLSLQTLKWGLGFRLTLVSTTRLGFHPVREQENKQRHGGVTADDKAFHWQASVVLFVTLYPEYSHTNISWKHPKAHTPMKQYSGLCNNFLHFWSPTVEKSWEQWIGIWTIN